MSRLTTKAVLLAVALVGGGVELRRCPSPRGGRRSSRNRIDQLLSTYTAEGRGPRSSTYGL
jgi:hypothetical protein